MFSVLARPRARLAALVLASGVLIAACAVESPIELPSDSPTGVQPVTLFDDTQPAIPSHYDTNPVEIGMRFKSSTGGEVLGLRFFKGAENTGTHVGNLWSAGGTKLASVTFTNESASGWQTAALSTPVRLEAGKTYVVSYFAPKGRYAAQGGYFTDNAATNGPLTAMADTSTSHNGVYRYGSSSGFPSSSYKGTNYWVDMVFQPDSGSTSTTQAPTTSTTAAPTTTQAPTTTTTAPPPPNQVPTSFPNASNTGVRPGTTLQRLEGTVIVDAAYAQRNLPGSGTAADPYIFENKLVTGMLQISVPHVLVRNCRVYGNASYGIWSPANHTRVEDCEVGPDGSTAHSDYGVSFEDFGTARRVHVHNTRVGMKVRDDGLIEDSYVHTLWQEPGSHNGGINSPDGFNGVVRHNTIIGNTIPYNGRNHNGVSIYTTWGPSGNWLIENNYFDHNGYHVFGAVTAPFVIRNNVMTDDYEHTPNMKWYYYNTLSGMTAYGNVNQAGTPIDR